MNTKIATSRHIRGKRKRPIAVFAIEWRSREKFSARRAKIENAQWESLQ